MQTILPRLSRSSRWSRFLRQRSSSTKTVTAALTLAAALIVPVSSTFAQEYYERPDYGYEYGTPPPRAAVPVYVAPPAPPVVEYGRPYYRPEVRYWHHWHRRYAPRFHHRHGRW